MKLKILLISIVLLIIGCGTPFPVINGFTIESIEKTQNGRCIYTVECERPALSCAPQFLSECNMYRVGDTIYLTLKKGE